MGFSLGQGGDRPIGGHGANDVAGHKYAPHWGRLHLKLGEAQVYTGSAKEAKEQFARAAQLDLARLKRRSLPVNRLTPE
jgi:hypothetical protein